MITLPFPPRPSGPRAAVTHSGLAGPPGGGRLASTLSAGGRGQDRKARAGRALRLLGTISGAISDGADEDNGNGEPVGL